MRKYSNSALLSALLITAFGAGFWAYTIIDTLIRDFHKDVSVIDLGVLYVLGLISGIALGVVVALKRKPIATE